MVHLQKKRGNRRVGLVGREAGSGVWDGGRIEWVGGWGCCKSRTTATNQNCTWAKKFTTLLTFRAGSSFDLPAGVWQENKHNRAEQTLGQWCFVIST